MIEVVSHPSNLVEWDKESSEIPFYLEVFGETSPRVAMNFAETAPVGPSNSTPQTAAPLPIYEYWWTIGHGESRDLAHQWSDLLEEHAASVLLFFPINKGWRIKELVATVKYLTPIYQQESWLEKVSHIWQEATPIVSDISHIASMVPAPAFSEVALILSTMAKLQINNVPQVDGFRWSVSKVTDKLKDYGVLQGIKWTLPKKMLIELGGRLTGSVAVSFIPSHIQEDGSVWDRDKGPVFQQGALLGRAEIHRRDRPQPIYVPFAQQGQPKDCIKLRIQPYA